MTDDNNDSRICWGNVLAGAAVTAGAMAAFVVDPAIGQQLVGGAKDIAGAIYAAVGTAGSAVGDVFTAGVDAASKNVPLAIGTAATAGAVVASCGGKKPAHEEAYAAREDIRRAQALMAQRMQEAGYAPAFALAGQKRG